MAQTKSSQSNPAARRGGSVASGGRARGSASAAPRPAAPVAMPAAGGRGRRTGNPFSGLVGFVRDVRSELRKVAWPTSRETVNLTIVVLALSVAMGLFLGGTDFLFQELFKELLKLTTGGSV